jgi:phage terminase large subunit-like protein
VLSGKVVTGENVKLACRRHLEDLDSGQARGLWWDEAEVQDSIDFFPAALVHWKGELGPRQGHPIGDPVVLTDWESFCIGSAFGWKRWDERREIWKRRFTKVYVEVAKKNGKTLIAAGVGLRLAFFDDEPGADVYSAATKRDQAKISWNDAHKARNASRDLQKMIKVSISNSVLYDPETGSRFEPLGKDSDTSQGINVHGAIIDELHVHADSDLYDNIETATAARVQPMIFIITTAGVKRDSIWWDVRSDVMAVLEGRAQDDTVFGYIASLDDEDDPWDESNWIKANPNLGHSVHIEQLRETAAQAERSPARQAAFFRFRLNMVSSSSVKAIDMREWMKPQNIRPPEPQPGWGCYGGLDLASVRDLTALVLLFRDEHEDYHVLSRFWCPMEGIEERSRRDGVPYDRWVKEGYLIATEGDVTDYEAVAAELNELAKTYAIGEIAYDRWNATQLVTQLGLDGAAMVPITQTYGQLSAPWKEIERLTLEGMLRHGGHPILRWMAENVELEMDPYENVRPSKRKSSERIDGMIALDMAVGRWLTWGMEPGVGRAY